MDAVRVAPEPLGRAGTRSAGGGDASGWTFCGVGASAFAGAAIAAKPAAITVATVATAMDLRRSQLPRATRRAVLPSALGIAAAPIPPAPVDALLMRPSPGAVGTPHQAKGRAGHPFPAPTPPPDH